MWSTSLQNTDAVITDTFNEVVRLNNYHDDHAYSYYQGSWCYEYLTIVTVPDCTKRQQHEYQAQDGGQNRGQW